MRLLRVFWLSKAQVGFLPLHFIFLRGLHLGDCNIFIDWTHWSTRVGYFKNGNPRLSPTSHFSDAMWEVWCEHSQSSLPISRFQYSAPFLTSHFTFPISHIFQSPLSTAFEVIPPINNTNFGSSTDKGTFEILFFYNLSLKSGKTSRKFSHEVGNEKWGMRNGKWEMGSGMWENLKTWHFRVRSGPSKSGKWDSNEDSRF